MDTIHSIGSGLQPQASHAELLAVFDRIDDDELIAQLKRHAARGPKGRWLRPLWRAYFASFMLNFDHTNDLIRNLQDSPDLRAVCGFDDVLPHRTTFNRFIQRLAQHAGLIESCIDDLINRLKTELPDLGEQVAVDSTAIRTYSNPNRKQVSDSDAKWGVKHSVRSKQKDRTEYFFGYKAHVVADVKYGIPLAQVVTPGNRNDSPVLPTVIRRAQEQFDWFRPKVVIADRGYDSANNHQYLHREGIIPVIHIRRPSNPGLHKGIYTDEGVPTCLGMVPMEYVGTDGNGYYVYRCRREGCHLLDSKQGGIRHCDTVYAQDPLEDIRLFGLIRRQSQEWSDLYRLRWSIEQLFKTQKQSRRLERHCTRGLANITLHSLMSTLSFLATYLVDVEAQRFDIMRWGVRKVA